MTHLGYMTKLFPSSPPRSSSSLFIVPKTATPRCAGFVGGLHWSQSLHILHFCNVISPSTLSTAFGRLVGQHPHNYTLSQSIIELVHCPVSMCIVRALTMVEFTGLKSNIIAVIPQSLSYSALLKCRIQLTIHLLIVPKHCSSHHHHHSILNKHSQMRNRSSSSPFF
ncbi:hypothetical protein BT96DRAFT_1005547 [Gymnopus androsaceus JB14]|uniref:Uncharacterized protein n=1 Tax=Gymnopus androsaceus JB14 TaxID=1447944 RepID=A0A6A4GMM3_9AGAR|nr:hypothetical protein BT96DRAFT_1005547 [Gymnopus androsaceus JB14]